MRTLFIDFDGTICIDRFWRSLPENEYNKIHQLLFQNENEIVYKWMRGELSSEQVNQEVANKMLLDYSHLWDAFVHDCKTMRVPHVILDTVQALRSIFHVVLITGNMDCFTRFTQPSLELDKYFDVIVNSFDEEKLKTDNDGESFIKYCKGDIHDAILVEDSSKTLEVFRLLGGTAYQTDSLDQTLEILKMLK